MPAHGRPAPAVAELGVVNPIETSAHAQAKSPHVSTSQHVDVFSSAYPEQVRETASAARRLLKEMLPGVAETVDESAQLLGYSYGPESKRVLFTLIMSQIGVKLGIFRGSELPDPKHLMAGARQGSPLRPIAPR
jgi:hypothetical protein